MKIAVLGAHGSGKTQLADELTRYLRSATAGEDAVTIVISDTPPLMAAIYAALLHGDQTLCEVALAQHNNIYDLTLVTGLDVPCSGGRRQHDGSDSREAVNARLRSTLMHGKIAFAVVYGQGPARMDAALKAISSLRHKRVKPNADGASRRQWSCEKCSDPECEHQMFNDLLKTSNGSR